MSFFDDFGDYPDFIVWLKDDVRQHVLLLTGPRTNRTNRVRST